MTANQRILNIKATADDAEALVCEYFNCEFAEIDEDGDIWIEKPQQGHWICDENKRAFANWCNREVEG